MIREFKKQILRYGKWDHPSAKDGVLEITPEYAEKLVENFQKNPYIPVVRGHVDNAVVEQNPSLIVSKNVKKLERDDKGINAYFEMDDKEETKYNDVSARIEPDYKDHETGEFLGDILTHVAMVMNPFIKKLDPFVALGEQKASYVINLSDIHTMTNKKSKVELEDEVKPEAEAETKEAEVVETEAEKVEEKAEEKTEETKETEEVKEEAETEEVEAKEESEEKSEDEAETEESAEGEKTEEVVETSDVQERILQLEETVAKQNKELAERDAEARYVELRDKGKVTPAMKDEVISLYMASKTSIDLADGTKKGIKEILDSLFDKAPAVIDFEEKGVDAEAVKSDIDAVLLSELRKQPEHAKKTDEEFNAYVEKNKNRIQEFSK